jgi:hypothetical protein
MALVKYASVTLEICKNPHSNTSVIFLSDVSKTVSGSPMFA